MVTKRKGFSDKERGTIGSKGEKEVLSVVGARPQQGQRIWFPVDLEFGKSTIWSRLKEAVSLACR